MNVQALLPTLATLLRELLDGPSPASAYMLNPGDVGLLRSLDALTACDASAENGGRASIAAHVEHLRYGLSLMNRWSAGENPFDTADWASSWRKTSVSDTEWEQLRAALAAEARQWLNALNGITDVSSVELSAVVGSVVHLAYHLGSIRQRAPAARGPVEPGILR
jgi:hypothetical protein